MTSTSSPLPDDTARDLVRLQGVWQQVRMEADGVVNPPDEHGGMGALTTIEGTQFSVRGLDGQLLLEGAFRLDASTTPRSITWIDAVGEDRGLLLPASYTLDDDRFEFIAAEAGTARPVVFHTRPGQTMRTFIRQR